MPTKKQLEERVRELEAQVAELESTFTVPDGKGGAYKYPRRDHPRFNSQPGNPYLPLDSDGRMKKGYVG